MSDITTGAAPTSGGIRAILGRRGAFWITLFVIAAVVIGFVWFLFQPSGQNGSPGILKTGQTAPNFSAQNAGGQPVTLAQFKGHPVIINFWGTFCLPCRSETPLLQRTYQAHQAQGLVVLGIDQAEQADAVAQYGKDYGLTYPLILDGGQKINRQYGVTALPVSYFVDANGVIRYAMNGVLDKNYLATGLHTIGING
jgi:cytochrome c biogenesis protein CcmG, thiol:disulfide interchange protein DsbE